MNHNATDCVNTTGWFTVFDPSNSVSKVFCDWYPSGVKFPYFLFVMGNHSRLMSGKVNLMLYVPTNFIEQNIQLC